MFTHVDGSRGGGVHRRLFVCLSVCLFIRTHDIPKADAARITKLDSKMFHDESWKTIYFGVERSKVKVTSYENSAGVGHCTPVSAGFLYFHYSAEDRRQSH